MPRPGEFDWSVIGGRVFDVREIRGTLLAQMVSSRPCVCGGVWANAGLVIVYDAAGAEEFDANHEVWRSDAAGGLPVCPPTRFHRGIGILRPGADCIVSVWWQQPAMAVPVAEDESGAAE